MNHHNKKQNNGKLFIVSAPSGAGKSTLVQALLHNMSDVMSIERVITYTSRAPRGAEQNGIDYHFIASHDFERRIQQGFFLEWSGAYQHYYGTPATIVQRMSEGVSLIGVIDRIGAQQLLGHIPDAITIWIVPPSIQELERRLRLRSTESEEQLTHRLARASDELAQENAQRSYRYHINNDNFDEALRQMRVLITEELAAQASE